MVFSSKFYNKASILRNENNFVMVMLFKEYIKGSHVRFKNMRNIFLTFYIGPSIIAMNATASVRRCAM